MPSISTFIEHYCATFRPGNAAAAVSYFHFPVIIVAGGSKLHFSKVDELKAMFDNGLGALQESGFSHSTVGEMHIHRLTDTVAIVSAAFTRWHEDGSVLENIAATYTLLAESGEDWKITALIAHDSSGLIGR